MAHLVSLHCQVAEDIPDGARSASRKVTSPVFADSSPTESYELIPRLSVNEETRSLPRPQALAGSPPH